MLYLLGSVHPTGSYRNLRAENQKPANAGSPQNALERT